MAYADPAAGRASRRDLYHRRKLGLAPPAKPRFGDVHLGLLPPRESPSATDPWLEWDWIYETGRCNP